MQVMMLHEKAIAPDEFEWSDARHLDVASKIDADNVSRRWLHYHSVRLCNEADVESVARAPGHADDGETAKAHYLGGGAIESAVHAGSSC
jgi:hypothetical protein